MKYLKIVLTCCAFFFYACCAAQSEKPGGSVYAPLWLYDGSWWLTTNGSATGAKPDRLDNHCYLFGKYFACQQTVNGKVVALIVFVPADKPGHYYSQAVMSSGLAGGRGDLVIDGDYWTYSSKFEDAGKTAYHRTTNVFAGKDRIHYEQAESSDGEHWTVKNSGDEQRIVKEK